ncbi:predicted protein [Aspergillus terreus NIH2624]|uniref:Aminoglycoside phosphotransferase domain-containing protein n=1 Tax=Aspergillus terreus (strain NIH 2624 / FGSC A1156) TaxID=341663 RepID=Q0C7J5_ASPTN|nr:uncharacterized protein ATEG_10339 [Aspergillus terreus NIH2624]EAU29336.1 predicted protein [Aspergillus terreus NIH2624]
MLALASQSYSRISSLTTDNEGFLHATNRPLTLRHQHMENEGIPTDIPRDLTYCTSEAYVLDLLRCHDNQIRHKPNAISDQYDSRAQMAALAAMRTIHPHYLRRDLRQGPFVLTLTDLHQSNIFVDDEWHIRCLIDLEWACALPADMLQLPWWLDDRGIDEMPEGEYLDSYGKLHDEFIQIFETEEKHFRSTGKTPTVPYAEILRTNWENGNFWFSGPSTTPKLCIACFSIIFNVDSTRCRT